MEYDETRTIAHYEILEKLGEGSRSVVYRARDTRFDRDVALKFLSLDFTGSEFRELVLKERLVKEARAVSVLDHPNICRIHAAEETDDGRLFVAMDYCQGVTIKEKVRAGPLPREEIVKLTIQTAAGLQAAHERGIMHLGINPNNLMVTPEGVVKILDFGISKFASEIDTITSELVLGKTAGRARDIWALGLVLYEMATGVNPFHGKNNMAVLYAIVHRDVGLGIERRPDLPVGLDKILRRALGKGRRHVYKNMGEILADLELLLQPLDALPQEKRTSRFRLRGRGRKWWGK